MSVHPNGSSLVHDMERAEAAPPFLLDREGKNAAEGLWLKLVNTTVLGAAIATFLAQVNKLHLERWDDAYITFRYARHLTDGLGMVWNVGGERVEGYTSLLHVILLSFGMKLGIDPRLWSLVLGVACVLLTCAVMLAIVSRHGGGIGVVSAILIGLYVLDPLTAVHATSGLETQVFVLLLNISTLLALETFDRGQIWEASLLAVVVVASCLTRPEAVLYGLGIFCALLASEFLVRRERKERRERIRVLVITSAIIVIAGLLYAGWKYSYFGYFLPNPYYVKSGKFSLSGLSEVIEYLRHLAQWYLPIMGLVVFGYVYVRLHRSRTVADADGRAIDTKMSAARKSRYAKALILLLPAIVALAYYTTIIHEVGGGSRFSYPTYSLLVLAAAVGISSETLKLKGNWKARVTFLVLAVSWFGLMTASLRAWHYTPRAISSFGKFHLSIGEALKATGLGSRGTIICDAAGVIPYVSGFNQVDRVGLTDNFLSGRFSPTPAEREAYLWSRFADVYIGSEPPASDGAMSPDSDPRMRSRYVSEILEKKPLRLVESRIFIQSPEGLFQRMRRLRDDWILVGELDWPGWEAWRLKSFVYVSRDSPYRELIEAKIRPLVRNSPDQIDLDQLDP